MENMVKCGKCGSDNRAAAKFCKKCGSTLNAMNVESQAPVGGNSVDAPVQNQGGGSPIDMGIQNAKTPAPNVEEKVVQSGGILGDLNNSQPQSNQGQTEPGLSPIDKGIQASQTSKNSISSGGILGDLNNSSQQPGVNQGNMNSQMQGNPGASPIDKGVQNTSSGNNQGSMNAHPNSMPANNQIYGGQPQGYGQYNQPKYNRTDPVFSSMLDMLKTVFKYPMGTVVNASKKQDMSAALLLLLFKNVIIAVLMSALIHSDTYVPFQEFLYMGNPVGTFIYTFIFCSLIDVALVILPFAAGRIFGSKININQWVAASTAYRIIPIGIFILSLLFVAMGAGDVSLFIYYLAGIAHLAMLSRAVGGVMGIPMDKSIYATFIAMIFNTIGILIVLWIVFTISVQVGKDSNPYEWMYYYDLFY